MDTLVKRLRRKIEPDPDEPRFILTVWGTGYKFCRCLIAVWYRSLYWRIAFGFVALLAAMLVAQGACSLWLTDASSAVLRSGPAAGDGVASELSAGAGRRRRTSRSTTHVRAGSATSINRSSS